MKQLRSKVKPQAFPLLFFGLTLLATLLTVSGPELSSSGKLLAKSFDRARGQLAAMFGRLPLRFEENRGQSAPEVKFLSRGNGFSLFLTSTEMVLNLHSRKSEESEAKRTSLGGNSAVLKMKLVGANPASQVTGLEELPGKSNYFIGNDPTQWRTNVPTYAKVRYEDIYPGINLVYYGNPAKAGQLEFDFIVAPGAPPEAIRFDVEGAEKLEIDAEGRLVIHTPDEPVLLPRPVVYQETGGKRQEIPGGYRLAGGNRVGFEVAAYDASRPLVIDPVLAYSTYLGGSGLDQIQAIAMDSSGNIYVAGITSSANFPTATPLRGTNAGGEDTFVAMLNPAGSALLYSTYLGGAGADHAFALAVDSSGTVYLAGDSNSTNFPTVNPLQASNAGGFDGIVAQLNANGSALIFSSYLGGSGGESALGVTLDASGNAYLTGVTSSSNFPLANPLQPARASPLDAFVAKLNPTGSALVYSTYLGGSGDDSGTDIAVDSSGNAFLVGSTLSANFPTSNPFQRIFGGGTCGTAPNTFPCPDVFVTKLNATGNSFLYSTYLGGNGDDEATGIAVDSSGSVYVTGLTASTNFPTLNPLQAVLGGLEDVFVTKLNPAGSALVYSTYLGGTVSDVGNSIAVDASGSAYVTGVTESSAFPVINPIQPRRGSDAFVTKFNQAGTALVYSTYLGGSNIDRGLAIAVDSSGNAYVAGGSNSDNFPRASPLQNAFGGGTCGTPPFTFTCPDGFVSKLVFRQAVNPGGMVNVASFAAGAAVSPGSIVAAFGTDITSSISLASVIPLPTTLREITVRINNIPAPLFFVSGGQLNLQAPWELAGQTQANVVVTAGSTALSPITVNLTGAAPGIFTMNSQGTGPGAILIASTGEVAAPVGSIPGRASRPAHRGEFVTIYCTGLGEVTNRPATGAAASRSPLSVTTAPVSVTIGGIAAPVSFAGLAPDFVGLYQINAAVPQDSPTGSVVPVVVRVGGAASNTVVMAVQ